MQRTAMGRKSAFGLKLLPTSFITLLSAQLALIAAALPLVLYAPVAIAQTQSAEAVGKLAQAITVV